MAFQEVKENKTEASFNEPAIKASKAIDDVDKQLIAMWNNYLINETYANPVELGLFFSRFTALYGYFYVAVNGYKLAIDKEVSRKTAEIYETYTNASVTERDGVIRRSERSIRSQSEYYLSQVSWAKGCINSMQTMLRLWGDETKMMGRTNA